MPEGVEVKQLRDRLAPALVGQVITLASIVGGRYTRVDPAVLGLHRLTGARIQEISCKGKLLVFHLELDEQNFAVLSTLGMTGWWADQYTPGKIPQIDRYKRILLQFADGSSAVFFDPRNFGTFKIVSTTELAHKLDQLGPDILSPRSSLDVVLPEFTRRVGRYGRAQALAEALLDQRISSGCGNYIRADAMYLAGMSPLQPVSQLSATGLATIWSAMGRVAEAAFNDEYPLDSSAPFHNVIYGQTYTPGGLTVQRYKDRNGRTVWYSPLEQL